MASKLVLVAALLISQCTILVHGSPANSGGAAVCASGIYGELIPLLANYVLAKDYCLLLPPVPCTPVGKRAAPSTTTTKSTTTRTTTSIDSAASAFSQLLKQPVSVVTTLCSCIATPQPCKATTTKTTKTTTAKTTTTTAGLPVPTCDTTLPSPFLLQATDTTGTVSYLTHGPSGGTHGGQPTYEVVQTLLAPSAAIFHQDGTTLRYCDASGSFEAATIQSQSYAYVYLDTPTTVQDTQTYNEAPVAISGSDDAVVLSSSNAGSMLAWCSAENPPVLLILPNLLNGCVAITKLVKIGLS